MLEKRVNQIAQKLSPQGREIYLAMIPAYISGYVDYVFQTDKPDVQARRIKNLDKNFRRLLIEPYFWIQPMSQESAEEIAKWCYPAPYDFYDMAADEEDLTELLSATSRKNTYYEVIRNGALFGFACFYPEKEQLEIGLGMKPNQTRRDKDWELFSIKQSKILLVLNSIVIRFAYPLLVSISAP